MAQKVLCTMKEERMPDTRLRGAGSSEAPPAFKTESLRPRAPPRGLVMAGCGQREGDTEALLLQNGSPESLLKSQEMSKLWGHNSLFRPEEEHELLSLAKQKHFTPPRAQGSHRLAERW